MKMITISETVEDEAQILCDIQKAAFLPLYEIYHDSSNPCLRGVEDILSRLNSPCFRYFTIRFDKMIVGGVLYKCAGRGIFFDKLDAGEYYLQRIYIRPDMQNRKIAQNAILLCEKEFHDAIRFTVDFPVDLEKNRNCYTSAGFQDTGKRTEAEPGLILACFEKML